MRILLEHCFDHYSSRKLYGCVAASLRWRGMEATVVQDADGVDVSSYDVLISHDYVERRGIDESATRVYGGREMTRPEGMAVIVACGVPVMPWALAANEAEVLDLFGLWQAKRLLLKRSGTFKGDGVIVFDRRHARALLWNPECDLFCPELNESDGDVYKIELFNGRMILGWVSRSPPLGGGFDGFEFGVKGAYGRRRLVSYSRALHRAALNLSRALTDRGIGYASLDLMRNSAGDLVAIEVNTAQVATWWTAKFPWMRWRYARAVLELIEAERTARKSTYQNP
jgi:hypothetical protein